MGLREGDEITVTANPPVSLTRYIILRPMVSLKRKLNSAPEADYTDAVETVAQMYPARLKAELELYDRYVEVLGSEEAGDLDALHEYLARELGDVREHVKVEIHAAQEEGQNNGQARRGKKAKVKKARKVARRR